MTRWTWKRSSSANFPRDYSNSRCSSIKRWRNWYFSTFNALKIVKWEFNVILSTFIKNSYFHRQATADSSFHLQGKRFQESQSERFRYCRKTILLCRVELLSCLVPNHVSVLFRCSEQLWLQLWLNACVLRVSYKHKLQNLVVQQ